MAPWDAENRWLDGVFASYAPGAGGDAFPAGAGRILPAGSKLIVQLHYTTTGRPEVDASRIGIYLSDAIPDTEYLMTGPVNGDIELPAGDGAYEASAEKVFDVETTLHGLFPHMHFRGKSFTYEAHYPNGDVETILSTPNYNFNWQRSYDLTTPIDIHPGDEFEMECHWDNSQGNQPIIDGEQAEPGDVAWGEGTGDEMCLAILYVTAL